MKLHRRACLSLFGVCLAACTEPPRPVAAPSAPAPPPSPSPPPADPLAELEQAIGGRVGVYAIDTESGATMEHRAGERFAMCSTFKWALAATVLARVERGELSLGDAVTYTEADLLAYAPTTREHVAKGQLTVEALCEAAVTLSDNTAANLLLERVGGPAALTTFLREHGDTVTRLDRDEPTLNENVEGDPRDTTSPRAMATTLQALALGDALKDDSRQQLVAWLKGCKTCDKRLHAGLPDDWIAGGKTGTCNRGACNDVAILWPPDGAPIVVAAYLSDSDAPPSELTAALASIGRILAEHFG